MSSLFYSSNQKRTQKYLNENKLREINQEKQQQIVDANLAREFGLEEQTSNIGNLTNRVINKLLSKDIQIAPVINLDKPVLTESIAKGFLSNVFNVLKSTHTILNKQAVKDKINQEVIKQIQENQSAEIIGNIVEKMLNQLDVPTPAITQAVQEVKKERSDKGKKRGPNIRSFANTMPVNPTEEPVITIPTTGPSRDYVPVKNINTKYLRRVKM